MISQNDKNLHSQIQYWGCCFLNKLTMPQIVTGNKLNADQINILYDIAEVEGIVGKNCYVNNDNAAILLPKNYNMILNYPKIVRLGVTGGTNPNWGAVKVNSTVLFIEHQIVDGDAEHFILYFADGTLAYNSKPGFMLIGNDTWYYYGITK